MKGNPIPVAILVRVSTTKQETDRQVSELASFAKAKGYEVSRPAKRKSPVLLPRKNATACTVSKSWRGAER